MILLKKIRTLFKIIYWRLVDLVWPFRPVKKINSSKRPSYSIGIVTYVNRYNSLFKPLIKNLCKLFPDTEIIIAINGYYDQEKQSSYLAEIKTLLAKYPNVKYVAYNEGQSLCKLWNQLIINASNDKVFIFNDDIKITSRFRDDMEKTPILQQEIGLLNWSWSHFIISKKIIKQVGWFDERLPGVGNEDDDYETRLVLHNILIQSYEIKSLKNIIFQTKDFSYGKDTETINIKYVKGNKVFFDKKWDTSTRQKEGYVFVRLIQKYAKLNPNMETPNFYPEINY